MKHQMSLDQTVVNITDAILLCQKLRISSGMTSAGYEKLSNVGVYLNRQLTNRMGDPANVR